MSKICRKCSTEKLIEFFSKHSGTADKLDNRCKNCVKLIKTDPNREHKSTELD